MHGQRDLLDWQDECKKRGNRRREARRNVEARGERMLLGMVSGVRRNNGMRVGEYLL